VEGRVHSGDDDVILLMLHVPQPGSPQSDDKHGEPEFSGFSDRLGTNHGTTEHSWLTLLEATHFQPVAQIAGAGFVLVLVLVLVLERVP